MSLSRPHINTTKSSSSSQWGDASRRPPSPTLSATTTGSRIDFSHPPHLLITRADLRNSISALTELMVHAKHYRQCLLSLSKATSAFAGALEVCSRVKGCDTANAGILGASGLEYLIGNHEQLMADTFYREFEIPLLHLLDTYKASVSDRQAAYEKACQEKSNLIRKTEHENMKHGRRRNRDLQAFRAALTTLQSLVDDLDFLKSSYHHEVMEGEDELWNGVLDKIAFVARAKMDVHDKVSSKSNDPSLEPLLHPIMNTVEDGAPFGDGTILNALAPLSLMSTPKSPQPALSRTPSRTPRRLQTPPSREIGGLPDSQSSPLGVPTQFDGLSQDKKGQNGTANTDRPDSAKDRRSFFGRLFKPSTDNLRTPGVGSSGPATSLTRHGRHHSQQSIASTAETYTEDSEVDDATDSRRRERNERVLMGRSVPSAKRGDAVKPGEKKLMPRVHVHAPIPNPRRTTSSPSVGGRQGRDQRELSVIEDDEAEDSRDSAVEGVAMLEGGAENGRIDDMEQGEIAETGSESLISDTSAMVIDASPTSAPASLGSRGVRDEKEGTGSPSNRIPEITSQSSATDFDQSSAKEQRLTDDPERDHGDQDQEMPSAPPSPSLEHELETIRDNSRRKASA